MNDTPTGTLYVVGTPIGNLEDLTFRAARILEAADAIAAEDTRHTGKLLQHFNIDTPSISYHEHNRSQRIPELIDRLENGETIALVSDAGMPGISDPGCELVRACAEKGIAVVPIPGASAVVTALAAAGIESDRFAFEGFLPAKGKPRQERLEDLQSESRAIVLYEAPHRLTKTLKDLAGVLGGDRPLAVARELTKLHEEFWRGSLTEAIARYDRDKAKGEFTLVVAGTPPQAPTLSEESLKSQLQALRAEGYSRSAASRELAKYTTHSRRHLYQLALALPDSTDANTDLS